MAALRKESFSSNLLDFISAASELLPIPFETPYRWSRRLLSGQRKYFYTSIFRLKKEGLITVTEKNSKKFIKITKKGQLATLLNKAILSKDQKWDGKWRMIIYDIPENSRDKRNKLRFLLREAGFKKLQASVFVSPHALNREAIAYLRETGLDQFIRICRMEEIDSDKDLKKIFDLK